MLESLRRLDIHHEPLHENPINAVFAHPLKVPQHRGLLERTEHLKGTPARIREARGEALVRPEFRNIRPQVHLRIARSQRPASFGPMHPPALGAITLTVEPA